MPSGRGTRHKGFAPFAYINEQTKTKKNNRIEYMNMGTCRIVIPAKRPGRQRRGIRLKMQDLVALLWPG